jgi:signal transduction histidine kinase
VFSTGSRHALLRVTTWSFVSLLGFAGGAVAVGSYVAQTEALHVAGVRTAVLAEGVVGPLVNRRVRAGHRPSVTPLEGALRSHIRSGAIAHVRLWDADHRLIWCDQSGLAVGGFELDPTARDLFAMSEAAYETSAPGGRSDSNDLQVHVGVRDADGVPLVVEAHLTRASVTPDGAAVMGEVMHLGLGALLLLLTGVVPLTLRLTRQARHSRRRYDEVSRRALVASETERRRIARDLHDGVVQELAGVGYALPSVTSKVVPGPPGDAARATASQLVAIVHRNVAALRTLLVDLYPPDLERHDIGTALERLAAEARQDGLEVEVRVDPDAELPSDVAESVYRVVREGLLNVRAHAEAAHVAVGVVGSPDGVTVSVVDDGVGLGDATPTPGHMGLRLMGDWLAATGGRLTLGDRPEGGAILTAQLPSS